HSRRSGTDASVRKCFFFPAEDGIRDWSVTGVQTCALPISRPTVSFYLRENETVGLVGESGCGKTTVGRTILRLEEPTGGRIVFDGRDITKLSRAELRPLRRDMQMIFQDLDAGLNPAMRVRDILREALTVHERPGDAEIAARIRELLEQVNLKDSKLANFPSELSGGEKRRVGIAR